MDEDNTYTFEALRLMTSACVLVFLSAHDFLPFPHGVLFEVYQHQQPLAFPASHLKMNKHQN